MDTAPGKMAHKEEGLLQKVLQLFYNTTGLRMTVETAESINNAECRADALVRLVAPGANRQFAVEIKPRLTQAILGMAVHQLERFPQKGLIVTDYVNPKMAERLKAMDMPFLDVAGNAYINEPPVYVYIKGNKPLEKPHRKPTPRAFQPTGLKVLFALLCRSGLEHAPYRDIAKAADVALGTVGRVITDLRELGYLVDMGKRGRRLTNKEKLIERWVTTYPEQLRPKLLLGRYKAVDHDWWKHAPLPSTQAYWGGEVAAAKLTNYLKPEQVTLYAQRTLGEFLLTNKLKKDPNGDVEILEAFWQTEYDWQYPELTPPLLIYADLLATGDARNIETARIIYEQQLAGLIRED
ncbi:MAG: hypothetical protein KZQ86_04045 [Candidatus Thiodiazotropha sp. (ex Lucinoma kastoroae)]|nr:hypothetical protein [Candidatus Thiodiazotropha sp. (ex Lucinoma kastoroae)]